MYHKNYYQAYWKVHFLIFQHTLLYKFFTAYNPEYDGVAQDGGDQDEGEAAGPDDLVHGPGENNIAEFSDNYSWSLVWELNLKELKHYWRSWQAK